jgi:hypothetical protein
VAVVVVDLGAAAMVEQEPRVGEVAVVLANALLKMPVEVPADNQLHQLWFVHKMPHKHFHTPKKYCKWNSHSWPRMVAAQHSLYLKGTLKCKIAGTQ